MRLKSISIVLALLLCVIRGWAAERHLAIPEITIPSGGTADFQIDLEDEEDWTICFDADIELPEGVTILGQENRPNSAQYTLNYARNDKMIFDSSYPFRGKGDDNDVRIILQTSDNSIITGKSGWIVKMPMTTTLPPGTYEAKMYNIHISSKSFIEIDGEDIIIKINVTEPVEIRYTDNQLFCNDIEINQGENAVLALSYNSSSDVYEYSANVILPTSVTPLGDVLFSNEMTSVPNFTNNSTWTAASSNLNISGVYGGGRRDVPAPSGIQTIGTVNLNTATLAAGEYEIKLSNQILSNDDDDYTPAEYVGKLVVKSTSTTPTEKCSTPIISVQNNHLYVHCDTEGATYHTSIVAHDHQDVIHGEDEPIELLGQYLVTSYASADGYKDSEPAIATLIWNKQSEVSIVDEIEVGTDRLLLLQSSGDNIVIAGLAKNEPIMLYDLSGNMLYQGNSDYESFTIPYSCVTGQIYIIKVGISTFKYLF